MNFLRCKTLFGEDYDYIQNSKILLLGVGGVGSFALDCLYRTGISNITIVDYDIFDITNRNRQIGSEQIGKLKIDVLKELYPNIKTINKKVDEEWIENFDFTPFDIVLDAIDDRFAKVALALKVYKKLISAVGSAKRYDATKIEVASIWKTHGDAFAKKIRYELRKRDFHKNYTVIFSSEEPKCKNNGSFCGVSATFGLFMCSQTIVKLLHQNSL